MGSKRSAITAIRDVDQERRIAASLTRIGWEVVFRATSVSGLLKAIDENPTALILQSDDFKLRAVTLEGDCIVLRGRSLPTGAIGSHDPLTDSELDELIRNRHVAEGEVSKEVAPSSKTLRVVASIGRNVGATTVAIAVADEIVSRGRRTLLVDANLASPALSHHFDINGIRSEIKETRFGFLLFELRGIEGMQYLREQEENFDEIIIDCGEISNIGDWLHGKRLQDRLVSWLVRSAAEFTFVTRSNARAISRSFELIECNSEILAKCTQRALIVLEKAMGAKERREISSNLGICASVISFDRRAIEKTELEHGTLSLSAPRSPIRGEIHRYLA